MYKSALIVHKRVALTVDVLQGGCVSSGAVDVFQGGCALCDLRSN